MYYIDKSNTKEHVYPTYGRRFLSYRWYKPIITGLVFAVLFLILDMAIIVGAGVIQGATVEGFSWDEFLSSASGGYDTFSVSDWPDAAVNLGSLAVGIIALALAAVIVRDRPFSSYQSARGGWSHKVFWKCFMIALVVCAVPILVREGILARGYENFDVKFTLIGFIVCTVLGPLQCIAEEYMFRGLLMQTLGSWFRIPVIAVVLQAGVFMLAHPYNDIGKYSILISGIGLGLAAWIARGIEASSAIHIANNMTIFYMTGLGMTKISSNVAMADLIMDACMYGAYVVIIFIISRKTNWFNEVRKDDVERTNARIEAKLERKAAREAAKAAAAGEGRHYKV